MFLIAALDGFVEQRGEETEIAISQAYICLCGQVIWRTRKLKSASTTGFSRLMNHFCEWAQEGRGASRSGSSGLEHRF